MHDFERHFRDGSWCRPQRPLVEDLYHSPSKNEKAPNCEHYPGSMPIRRAIVGLTGPIQVEAFGKTLRVSQSP